MSTISYEFCRIRQLLDYGYIKLHKYKSFLLYKNSKFKI
jgi:hypothetical protein